MAKLFIVPATANCS